MQAIEMNSIVRDQTITLPAPSMLSPGQPVRVLVMFDVDQTKTAAQSSAEHQSDQPPMIQQGRLAALVPHPEALGDPLNSPWDESAWRKKWESSQ
jgi:hypothetical protein